MVNRLFGSPFPLVILDKNDGCYLWRNVDSATIFVHGVKISYRMSLKRLRFCNWQALSVAISELQGAGHLTCPARLP